MKLLKKSKTCRCKQLLKDKEIDENGKFFVFFIFEEKHFFYFFKKKFTINFFFILKIDTIRTCRLSFVFKKGLQ